MIWNEKRLKKLYKNKYLQTYGLAVKTSYFYKMIQSIIKHYFIKIMSYILVLSRDDMNCKCTLIVIILTVFVKKK